MLNQEERKTLLDSIRVRNLWALHMVQVKMGFGTGTLGSEESWLGVGAGPARCAIRKRKLRRGPETAGNGARG